MNEHVSYYDYSEKMASGTILHRMAWCSAFYRQTRLKTSLHQEQDLEHL